MAKIIIFGGKGYIGSHLRKLYPDATAPAVDIADEKAVAAALDELKPDVIINAAGKTGRPNVDWCEDHKSETIRSNITGPLILLDLALKRGLYFVHLGSGCIYDGDNGGRGFTEEDPPNFFGSFYSRTKLWSDQMLKEFPVLQLRLRMPFDGSDEPRNLIRKLRGYTRVLDQANSITYIPDFLRTLDQLMGKRATGVFNMVNPGPISPYEIMCRYKEKVDPSHTFERLSLADLPQVVSAGRSNCILSCEKLQREGIVLTQTGEALEEAFRVMKKRV